MEVKPALALPGGLEVAEIKSSDGILIITALSTQMAYRCEIDGKGRVRSRTEKELSQFKNVLRTFQDALPFVEETDLLLKHWEFCYERSIGCVGNLRLMLVKAVRAALWADAKTLRWSDLKTHAFSEAESYEMMREAYEGEKELASKPKQHADLLKMLGLSPQNMPRTNQPPDVPTTDETITGSEATQVNQPDETAEGAKQALPTEETPSETPSELNRVHSDQPGEATNEAIQGLPTEGVPHEEAPPKPLKKPSRATSQPFRRKTKRDKTGGPPRENEERD